MKRFSLLLAATILAGSLAGCQGGGAGTPSTPTPSQPAAGGSSAQTATPSSTPDTSEPKIVVQAGPVLSKGPHGEEASDAYSLTLTDEEIAKVKAGGYKAAIVFHYSGNDWSRAQQMGLKDTFDKLGIEIVATTDANFKAEQQATDIETALALKPDVMVSIPVDPVSTSNAFKKAAATGVKIVFMDNCPDNMEAGKDYVSVVSADNYGNGVMAAEIMGQALGGKGKIGVIFHDANFFVTNQRVEAFEATIKEKYPNIEIVDRGGFTDPNKVSEVADAMLTKNPDINGIFGNWDLPAEAIVSSAVAAGRTDLVVTTIDLGDNVARIIAEKGIIKGLGAQLPYDQGVAEATLAAYALLGKEAPAYVAVPAQPVTYDNVLEAYQTVYHQPAPDWLKQAHDSAK